MAFALGSLLKSAICQVRSAESAGKVYPFLPLTFTYSNAYDKEVGLRSVRLLSWNVNGSIGGPSTYRESSHGTIRQGRTPEFFKNNALKFFWWEKRFSHPDSPSPVPIDPSKGFTASLPFPEFDVSAKRWECHYTLQPNNTWVGQFEGVTVKPIGADPTLHNVPTLYPDQPWIHFQFKNDSGKQILIPSKNGRLLTEDRETLLFLPTPHSDGEYRGFAAHCHQGSIFRPELNSKISFTWRFYRGGEETLQEFALPKFSDEQKNWYCYFIFDKDEKWTSIFEGVD